MHDADSVLFQLHSRHFWTPYFWEQDRVGMLWPLLTKPIPHPLANLFFQNGITIFCGLAFPFVLLRTLDRHASYGPAILLNVLVLTNAPTVLLQNWTIVCLYPSALFLGGCGLLAFEKFDRRPWRSLLVGVGLLALAHWVYVAAIVVLGPLAVARLLLNRNRVVGDRIAVAATLAGLAFGIWLMKYCQTRFPGIDVTPLSLNSLGSWLWHVSKFLEHLGRDQVAPGLILFSLLLMGFGLFAQFQFGSFRRLPWGAMGAMLAISLGELLVMSLLEWPCRMDHHPRYLLAGVAMTSLAVLHLSEIRDPDRPGSWWQWLLLTLLFRVWRGGRFSVTVGFFTVITVLSLASFDLPSVAAVRADFDARFGERTETFLAGGADALGDEYWSLWPALYHLELVRYERGLPPLANAVGLRTSAYWPAWQAAGAAGFVVAIPKPIDEHVDPAATERGLAPFEFLGEDENFAYFRTRIVFRPFPGKPAP